MSYLSRWLMGSDPTFLTPLQRATHTYVIGQPGTGKSRALEAWAMQDIIAGKGVAVIDPHGDLFRHLVVYLAAMPEIQERVVILDPCDRKWVVGFNPLEAVRGMPQERLALFLTDVMVKIWKLDPTSAPRMMWLLTNTFLALSGLGLTLLDLPRFLLDGAFRDSLLPRLSHEGARAYFSFEFPKGEAAVHQWVTPALNKIAGLIFDPDIKLMLTGRSTLNFREALDRKLVLLVHLPKGIIGEGTSPLLGAFIVAHLQKAALSRADTSKREPYFLYLDEFQNYTTDNIKDILSESRKYGLSLTLAHQYLDQLSPDFKSAVLNTTGTVSCFRVGYQDAYQLAKEIFPSPDFLSVSERKIRLRRFGRLPFVTIEKREESLRWEGLAQVLASLPSRQFWARRRGPHLPVKLRTLAMPDPVFTTELKERVRELRDTSGARYGRLKRDVHRELLDSRAGLFSHLEGSRYSHASPQASRETRDIPLWGNYKEAMVLKIPSCRGKFERAEPPPAMRFQERDGAILQAIHAYDGVLARRHLKAMFWPDASWRAMEMRVSVLYHQGYLDWPDLEQRRTKPIPEPICWLGWKGALWLAGRNRKYVEPPRTLNEAQLRRLDSGLRAQGFHWLREPRWSQLKHDLAAVDFRVAVEKAVAELPALTLETWILEGVFLSEIDIVEYQIRDSAGKIRQVRRGVRPDGYFVIVDEKRRSQGLPARARFLLELDMATHDTGSFFREKVVAGLAYISGPAYKARFGDNAGRWLIVTTGGVRLKHLVRQTHKIVATDAFLFSTLERVANENVLIAPIWWQAESEKLLSLFQDVNHE